jgi:hypothetical protein
LLQETDDVAASDHAGVFSTVLRANCFEGEGEDASRKGWRCYWG